MIGLEARINYVQHGCVCLGEPLVFQCSILGGGTTVWQGSAFHCPLSSDEIHLLHSQFNLRIVKTCNNGEIIGRALRTEAPDCFVSELKLQNVTRDLVGKRVECQHDKVPVNTTLTNSTLTLINSTELVLSNGEWNIK